MHKRTNTDDGNLEEDGVRPIKGGPMAMSILICNSSLYPLVACHTHQYVTNSEISVTLEKWHPEMNTFHLPYGEMTIMLDDITCLFGFPVIGKSVCQPERLDVQLAIDLLVLRSTLTTLKLSMRYHKG